MFLPELLRRVHAFSHAHERVEILLSLLFAAQETVIHGASAWTVLRDRVRADLVDLLAAFKPAPATARDAARRLAACLQDPAFCARAWTPEDEERLSALASHVVNGVAHGSSMQVPWRGGRGSALLEWELRVSQAEAFWTRGRLRSAADHLLLVRMSLPDARSRRWNNVDPRVASLLARVVTLGVRAWWRLRDEHLGRWLREHSACVGRVPSVRSALLDALADMRVSTQGFCQATGVVVRGTEHALVRAEARQLIRKWRATAFERALSPGWPVETVGRSWRARTWAHLSTTLTALLKSSADAEAVNAHLADLLALEHPSLGQLLLARIRDTPAWRCHLLACLASVDRMLALRVLWQDATAWPCASRHVHAQWARLNPGHSTVVEAMANTGTTLHEYLSRRVAHGTPPPPPAAIRALASEIDASPEVITRRWRGRIGASRGLQPAAFAARLADPTLLAALALDDHVMATGTSRDDAGVASLVKRLVGRAWDVDTGELRRMLGALPRRGDGLKERLLAGASPVEDTEQPLVRDYVLSHVDKRLHLHRFARLADSVRCCFHSTSASFRQHWRHLADLWWDPCSTAWHVLDTHACWPQVVGFVWASLGDRGGAPALLLNGLYLQRGHAALRAAILQQLERGVALPLGITWLGLATVNGGAGPVPDGWTWEAATFRRWRPLRDSAGRLASRTYDDICRTLNAPVTDVSLHWKRVNTRPLRVPENGTRPAGWVALPASHRVAEA